MLRTEAWLAPRVRQEKGKVGRGKTLSVPTETYEIRQYIFISGEFSFFIIFFSHTSKSLSSLNC